MTSTNETEQQPAGLDGQPAENKKKKGGKDSQPAVALPFVLELVFQFSGFFLFLISVAVALVSFLSGAQFLQIFIRTGITIVAFGILLLGFSTWFSHSMMDAALKEAQERQGQPAGAADGRGTRQDIKA